MAAEHQNVYLDEDPIKIPGQSFLLLSVVAPEGRQKADQLAVKVRGVFGTRDEADAHAKKLMSVDPSFDVFVADMYRWLILPPPVDQLEEEYSNNELLNELIHGYRESQQKSKEFFEKRVREDVEEGEGSAIKDMESELAKGPELAHGPEPAKGPEPTKGPEPAKGPEPNSGPEPAKGPEKKVMWADVNEEEQ